MKKRDAIIQISKGVKVYDKLLNNQSLLIIFGSLNSPYYIEIHFKDVNFLHLTGVVLKKNNCPSAKEFYNRAINNKLSETDFDIKDCNTLNKLSVLSKVLSITQNATMIGDYRENHINLYSEKIAGSVNACLGFVLDNNSSFYVPNTVLKEDIRKVTITTYRIFAVLSKKINDNCYSKVLKIGKNVNIEQLIDRFEQLYSEVSICNDSIKTLYNTTDNEETAPIILPITGRK